MFWLGFFNQADLHGQTLRSLFSSHLAATENVRNRNRCYLRAGIPPKFPPWGEYRESKTFPDSSLLISLHPLASDLTRKRCQGSNKHFAEWCKTSALKLWNGPGLELSSARTVWGSSDLPALLLMNPWKLFQMLQRLFFKHVNFISLSESALKRPILLSSAAERGY